MSKHPVRAADARKGLKTIKQYLKRNKAHDKEALDTVDVLIQAAAANARDSYVNGKPSVKQAKILKEYDLTAETKAEASDLIAELARNGWQRPAPLAGTENSESAP